MSFIKNVNKYLIERYPTIWNTKIVWMLSISLLVHILFFLIGYVSHSNPISLQNGRVFGDYYSSGMIMVHIIISLLMLVGWLVYMFKNNAFKNFYPTSNLKLFGQFVSYFIIVFASITFYFSYMLGFQVYIKNAYPDDQLIKDVAVINKAYPFLSLDYQEYKLNKRAYPKQFKELFCETDRDEIDYNKKYFELRDDIFQFNSTYLVKIAERDEYREFKYPAKEYKNKTPLAYKNIKEDTCYYYFKKDVVDVSPFIKTTALTYYNFSKVFYELSFEDIEFYDRYNSYSYGYPYAASEASIYDYEDVSKNYEFSKQLTEILDRKNPEEFKKIMNDFLEVSKKFKINHNLETDKWFHMVYHPENFEVKRFINTNETGNSDLYPPQPPIIDSVTVTTAATYDTIADTVVKEQPNTDDAAAIAAAQNAAEQVATVVAAQYTEDTNYNYYHKNLSKSYYEINSLKDLLRSVELMKNSNVFDNVIHFYIWIAFALATLLFSFRVTNLRSIIFTGVTVGVLSLTIGLIVLFYTMGVSYDEEYFAAYLILFISTIILLLPILAIKTLPRLIGAILMNISISGFVLYVFLILGIISMHQNDACYDAYNNYSANCTTILEFLDLNTSYLLLALGLIFMLCYTVIIKKWRAQPE